MSRADLTWSIVRNNHAFLMKRHGLVFSKEPNNLKGKNCFQYNGFIHKKTIGIQAEKSGKGLVLTTKRVRASGRPKYQHVQTTLKNNSRANLNSVRTIIRKNKYRPELEKLALKRASAILKSQERKKIAAK